MSTSYQSTLCQLEVGPFFQCCCNCVFHIKTAFHCCTEPKPPGIDSENKKDGERMCVCETQKGYACIVRLAQGGELIHDGWREHSVGCELYTPRTENKLVVSYEKQKI